MYKMYICAAYDEKQLHIPFMAASVFGAVFFCGNKAERNPILNMKHVNRNKSAGGLIVDGEKWKYRELGIDG